jgi:hypothetical protein
VDEAQLALRREQGDFEEGGDLPSMAFTILLAKISDESSEDIHHPLMLLRAL